MDLEDEIDKVIDSFDKVHSTSPHNNPNPKTNSLITYHLFN
mgnify:CR=1 FL=1